MTRPADRSDFHVLSAAQALEALESTRARGLDDGEAARRQLESGPNRLPEARRRSRFARFAAQFRNVLIYVLILAAVVTAALGHFIDSAVIAAVVLINALIGYVQEGKAEQALDAIRGMLSSTAQVLRGGSRRSISSSELVPGDIVLLAAGDKVPADLRLVEVRGLRADESALTGESVPVDKRVEPVDAAALLGDRVCMAFSGTLVTYGQAVGVVTAIGIRTELGRISAMLVRDEALSTPLLRQLARFGHHVTWAILVLALLTFAFGVAVREFSAGEMFLAAVGLAVAAIPEGLPAVMTIALAIGVKRMADRNAIIRRLPAVEALGSVTVICSDKTGTLTRNEMTVQRALTADGVFDVSGVGYAPIGAISGRGADAGSNGEAVRDLARAALLCNDAMLARCGDSWQLNGDPTEGALLSFALKSGLDARFEAEAFPRADVIPFESEHRFMATLNHDHAGHRFIFVKGAPERVMGLCATQRVAGEDRPIDRAWWHALLSAAAGEGMRLLAVAERVVEPSHVALEFADVEAGGFALLGVLAMTDPPRDEAIAAVARCREAGIRVRMITGDHAETAQAIGQRLGLGTAVTAMTGADIEGLSDDALREAVARVEIFARASPEHKLRLVKALQARGEVVVMTGDGVNDAPALKSADIGVAMGCKGTEAAREAAEVVLTDDNFATIAAAVEEGRTVYENLRKAIVFILPTNGGEALLILAAIAAGLTLPITPVQVLWVNMITAVTLALALAFEPGEGGVMRRAPRDPRDPLLDRFLVWRIALVSALLVAASLGQFLLDLSAGASLEAARTAAVNALVVGEVAYLFSVRRIRGPAFGREALRGLRPALLAAVLVMLAQMAFTYLPTMQTLFGSAAIGASEWLRIGAIGVLTLIVVEAEKAWRGRGSSGPSVAARPLIHE